MNDATVMDVLQCVHEHVEVGAGHDFRKTAALLYQVENFALRSKFHDNRFVAGVRLRRIERCAPPVLLVVDDVRVEQLLPALKLVFSEIAGVILEDLHRELALGQLGFIHISAVASPNLANDAVLVQTCAGIRHFLSI